jgi:MSHA biogenesis protein MshO
MSKRVVRYAERPKKSAGFTLIETIAVLIILSIVVTIGSHFFIQFIQGQRLVDHQTQLWINSQLTLTRMSKQLRQAMPYSLRLVNGNRCVTFMPVVAEGIYFDELPDAINSFTPAGKDIPISVLHHTVVGGSVSFMVVGAAASTELYGNSAGSIQAVDTQADVSITLVNNQRWLRNSSDRRFYLTDSVRAFCLVANELRYYDTISQSASAVNLASHYTVLAQSVTALGNAFLIDYGSNACQHCITLALNFSDDEFDIAVEKTVVLRYGH